MAIIKGDCQGNAEDTENGAGDVTQLFVAGGTEQDRYNTCYGKAKADDCLRKRIAHKLEPRLSQRRNMASDLHAVR